MHKHFELFLMLRKLFDSFIVIKDIINIPKFINLTYLGIAMIPLVITLILIIIPQYNARYGPN